MFKHIRHRLIVTHLSVLLVTLSVLFLFLFFSQRGVNAIIAGFVVAGLCGLIIAIVLSILTAKAISKPLQHLARAGDSMTLNQSEPLIDQDQDLTSFVEIEAVTNAFDQVKKHVQTNRIAMGDFIANASHELKTPLTSIQGFSQAIMEDAARDTASRKKAATIIYDEATRMRRLIDDLLDLARIDSGQIIIGKSPVNLASILKVTLDTLAPQIQPKHLDIHQQFDDLPNVVGDGDRLAQVFLNLIDNAIKYTPSGKKIWIAGKVEVREPFSRSLSQSDQAAEQREFVTVMITDSGPGIDAENVSRIFERLYRVDKSRKRDQGLGLGLAIAYNIVKAHGGEIQVKSKIGKGTRFTVWLPTKESDVSTLITKRQMMQQLQALRENESGDKEQHATHS
ncbi:MAG: HAMP domain-containing sensor histidine kinase [Chloroflexota bacterium]